jgi:hypothetical protein
VNVVATIAIETKQSAIKLHWIFNTKSYFIKPHQIDPGGQSWLACKKVRKNNKNRPGCTVSNLGRF